VAKDALLALCFPFHYYGFDGLGFPFMCLHLLQHALYFLWMDFHPCLYIHGFFGMGISTIYKKIRMKSHMVTPFVHAKIQIHELL
jgi:hypothetical protein